MLRIELVAIMIISSSFNNNILPKNYLHT